MVANPKYEEWLTSGQQVFSFILASVSKEILARIATATTAAQAWEKLEVQFTSQTRLCAITTRMALATSRKGSLSVAEYLAKMQGLANDMAAAGKALDDEDLVQYIMYGLDEDYDSVVNSVLARPIPITVSELAAQIISFEARIDLRSNDGSDSSVNFSKHSRVGFGRGPGGRGRGRGGRSPAQCRGDQNMRQCSGGRGSSNDNRPQCQVCRRYGHTADMCWHRFDEYFVPDSRHIVAIATNSYTVDNDWYTDSGATDHITSELDKLAIRDKYNDTEKVRTASGAGMEISHTSNSFIHTSTHTLELCNVLHVPKATKKSHVHSPFCLG
jgi:hypothetical protein